MDTIELVWKDLTVAEAFVRNAEGYCQMKAMRDKDSRQFIRGRRGYDKAILFSKDAKQGYLAFDSTYPRAEKGDDVILLQVHLSHFDGLSDFESWVLPMFGPYQDKFYEAEIRRLDTCIDVNVPIDTIVRCLSLPKVSQTQKFNLHKKLKSFHYGKFPRTLAVYEKMFQSGKIFDYPVGFKKHCDANGKIVFGTRLEFRHRGHKLPVNKYADLKQLQKINPFKDVVVRSLEDAVLHEITDTKRRETLAAYQMCQEASSAKLAQSIFSKGNNFSRQIAPYLRPLNLDLEKAWSHRAKSFFGNHAERDISVDENDLIFFDDPDYYLEGQDLILGGDDE